MMNSVRKVLSAYAGKTLVLHRPSVFKRNFQLLFENEVIGSIEITGSLKSNAVVRIFDRSWEIKRESFWRSTLGVYPYGYELPIATYSDKIRGGGVLKMEKGIILKLFHNILKGISEIKTESGKILVSAKNKSAWKSDREIKIIERNELIDSKPWILLLLLFVDVARQRR